jgi:acyl-CoA reductase-like NAD-dependent aldehyde dehydrogenase
MSNTCATARPFYSAGRRCAGLSNLTVTDKHSGEPLATVSLADENDIAAAIAAAEAARAPLLALPAWRRREILLGVAAGLVDRRAHFTDLLIREAGKVQRDATGEVERAIQTFTLAAAEAVRLEGRIFEGGSSLSDEGRRAYWRRLPLGVASFITPFNFPLNLVAHKIAPAIAAGVPFVLKPASLAPLCALELGALLDSQGLPPGSFAILPTSRAAAGAFSSDLRLKVLSFTGSDEVGFALKARANHMRVVLELGGNAAAIVCADWPLEDAVERIARGAFSQAGQSCISVQRVLVERRCWEPFCSALLAEARTYQHGDPRDPATLLGPLITRADAERLERWVHAAVVRGARLLLSGERQGARFPALVLTDVPRDCDLYQGEAFGPVVLLEPFDRLPQAIAAVNDSRYGLQAGLFSDSAAIIERCWQELEVGALIVGDVPTWRSDALPYGGVKASGQGREGPRFAIEDLTEPRLMVQRQRPSDP